MSRGARRFVSPPGSAAARRGRRSAPSLLLDGIRLEFCRSATVSAAPVAARERREEVGKFQRSSVCGRVAGHRAALREKAAVNTPQSRRFAKLEDAGQTRQHLEFGPFSTAFGRCASVTSVARSTFREFVRNHQRKDAKAQSREEKYPEGITSFSPALARRRRGYAGWDA